LLKLFGPGFRKANVSFEGRIKKMSNAAVQSDAIWLSAPDYKVTAFNSKAAARVPELKQALQTGVAAFPDSTRNNFYDVELVNGWAYIHVRADKQTVYLVAYSHA
jgi:hypothetical protein